jgi:NADP-dependent 3-hydroxy acid dehydrogenase YdfG
LSNEAQTNSDYFYSMGTFANQIALVTGASGGIGGAIAAALASQGATVWAVGRDISRLEALRSSQAANASSIEPHSIDLTNEQAIIELAEIVGARHGRLDILIHSAGTISHGSVEEAGLSSFDRLYATNVRGPYLLTQKLLPLLKKPRGQIVFINSSAGLSGRANTSQYSATQHAMKAVAESVREELNSSGVRVLTVHPGRTATALMEAYYQRMNQPYRPELLLQPEDVASVVANALALPWTAEVTSISIRPMQKSY